MVLLSMMLPQSPRNLVDCVLHDTAKRQTWPLLPRLHSAQGIHYSLPASCPSTANRAGTLPCEPMSLTPATVLTQTRRVCTGLLPSALCVLHLLFARLCRSAPLKPPVIPAYVCCTVTPHTNVRCTLGEKSSTGHALPPHVVLSVVVPPYSTGKLPNAAWSQRNRSR